MGKFAKKLWNGVILGCMLLCLGMTLPVSAYETEQKITAVKAATEVKDTKVKQGVYREKGKLYYYKDGEKQYNFFRKIKGHYYYFGPKGYAVKYTIIISF